VVSDLQALMDALVEAGRKPRLVAPVRQPTRFTLHDPFGNRLEFVQAGYATPGMALSSAKNLARGPGQQTATRG
jgi:hypothetical protein